MEQRFSPARRPGWRSGIAQLALVGAAIGLSLGVGEVLARLAFDNTVLFPRYHSAVQYGDYTLRRLQPNATFWHTSVDGSWQFRINGQGFRDDDDYAHLKPEGMVRILVLGDSQTQGFEVDQEATYAAVIERHLARHGIPAETVNAGVSGMGTAEQLLFLENEGLRYDPDIVVLGFFANDFEDNLKSRLFALDDGVLEPMADTYAPATGVLAVINRVPPLRWLGENSHLYSIVMNNAWYMAKRAAAAMAEEDVQLEYAVPAEAVSDYKKRLVARLLERMHRQVRAGGARLIVADIPAAHGWETGVALGPDNRRTAGTVGSVPLDLRPAFQAHSDRFIPYEDYAGDYRDILPLHRPNGHRHITEFTHALLGVAIAREIRRMVEGRGDGAYSSLARGPEHARIHD